MLQQSGDDFCRVQPSVLVGAGGRAACGQRVSYGASALGYHRLSLHIQKSAEQSGRRFLLQPSRLHWHESIPVHPNHEQTIFFLYILARSNYARFTDGELNTSSLNNLQSLGWQMVGETDPGFPKPPLSAAVSGSPRGLPPPQLQLWGLRQQ